jgi:hypothetical protein
MEDPYDSKLPKSITKRFLEWEGLPDDGPKRKGAVTGDGVRHVVRGATCISCWHCNTIESAAMWSLYSPHHGVAIKTTIASLIRALEATTETIEIGKVQYIDFRRPARRDSRLWSSPTFVKRKSFEHERELRAAVLDLDVYRSLGTQEQLRGAMVNVDVEALIERVYISPTVEDWIREVVKEELRIHGLPRTDVIRSSLYSEELA